MILGLGIDLFPVARLERELTRWGAGFLDEFLSEAERLHAREAPWSVARVAASFAGKEAILKTLGTGRTPEMRWEDIEILPLPHRGPGCTTPTGSTVYAVFDADPGLFFAIETESGAIDVSDLPRAPGTTRPCNHPRLPDLGRPVLSSRTPVARHVSARLQTAHGRVLERLVNRSADLLASAPAPVHGGGGGGSGGGGGIDAQIRLHGAVASRASDAGILRITLELDYSGDHAFAIATAEDGPHRKETPSSSPARPPKRKEPIV